ncbi:hypothetical protein BJX99DRAFT_239694 [Aspergillus californicus]
MMVFEMGLKVDNTPYSINYLGFHPRPRYLPIPIIRHCRTQAGSVNRHLFHLPRLCRSQTTRHDVLARGRNSVELVLLVFFAFELSLTQVDASVHRLAASSNSQEQNYTRSTRNRRLQPTSGQSTHHHMQLHRTTSSQHHIHRPNTTTDSKYTE